MTQENQESFFRNKSRMMGTALVLVLASLVLINWGLRDGAWAFWLGMALLLIGLLLATLSRFTSGGRGEDEDTEDQGENGNGGEQQ